MSRTDLGAAREGPPQNAQTAGQPDQDTSRVMVQAGSVNVRDAAAWAAERGWYVFPTRAYGKEPRPGLSWPTVATRDPARVRIAHWRPGENYGVAAKPSGLIILDLDVPRAGAKLPPEWQGEPDIVAGDDILAYLCERAGQPWPVTFWVRTPRGGHHLYYRADPGRPIGCSGIPDPLRLGQKCPLIDVKAAGGEHGGYVLGPGSVLDERAYPDNPVAAATVKGGKAYEVIWDQEPAPVPSWLADLLDPPETVTRPVTSGHVPGEMYPRLRGLVETVLRSQPGNRNAPLYWAACRAREMVEAGEIGQDTAEQVLVQAAVEAGLRGGESEARRTVTSGMRSVA